MNLTSISEIKRIMDAHGLTFKKQFGQNFLVNPSIPERIAGEAGDNVLEIGPGIGTLTSALCRRAVKVAAVEIDRGLIPVLGETLAEYDNITVVNADIMKLDLPAFLREQFGDGEVSVCANLPYYITTPVIMLLLESGANIGRITVMVQKEVAQRLTAAPGTGLYGAITASVSWYGTVRKCFDVPAGNFIPRPKVDSAVISIDTRSGLRSRVSVLDENLLFRIISAAFGMRRKTLQNALSQRLSEFPKDATAEIIKSCGLEPSVRGECLSVSDFAGLSDAFFNYRRLYELPMKPEKSENSKK